MSCIISAQIYFQSTAQYLVVMLLHVSATSRSHLQGAPVNNCCLCLPVRRTVYSQISLDKINRTYACRHCFFPAYLVSLNILLLCRTYIWCDNTCCSYSPSDIYGEIQRSFKWKAENLNKIRNMKQPVINVCV